MPKYELRNRGVSAGVLGKILQKYTFQGGIFALDATALLLLQWLVPISLPSHLLPLLQLGLPCHSLLRSLSLLNGWRPLRQQLLRYCPPSGPSAHILLFFLLPTVALPSTALPSAAMVPAATPPTVLLFIVMQPAVTSSTHRTVTCHAATATLRHRTRLRPIQRCLLRRGPAQQYLRTAVL